MYIYMYVYTNIYTQIPAVCKQAISIQSPKLWNEIPLTNKSLRELSGI